MNQEFLTCGSYEVYIAPLLKILREAEKPLKILLQAPDGLKHIYECLFQLLRDYTKGVELYLSASPSFGACDLPVDEAVVLGVDLIVHIGHEKYELAEYEWSNIPVVYLPVFYNGVVDESLFINLRRVLEENKYYRITVSSSLVESKLKNKIAEYLLSSGFTVYNVSKPVIGCFYSNVLVYDREVDAHLVVVGGVFHPLGLALSSTKPVIGVDPYMNRVWSVSEEAVKVLKRRFYEIYRARNAGGKLGLIIGARFSQYRPKLVEYLERLAVDSGYRVYRVTAGYLDVNRLVAIDDALKLDLYVVTSCPRLPIDDLNEFYKPVLTPGEFIAMVRGLDRYIYPW